MKKNQFRSLTMTLDQYRVIKQAIELVRAIENDNGIPKGRALELICGDFLSGHYGKTGFEGTYRDPWEGLT